MHRWKMAQGDIIKIEHEANSQWTGIHPGTVSDSKWKVACEILNQRKMLELSQKTEVRLIFN